MAATDKDISDHLAAIRGDMSALMQTVAQLASETDSIKKSIAARFGDAAQMAVDAGDWILDKAESLGGEAVHVAGRGAATAVTEVQGQIKRNPLTAVLIAVGLGLAIGLFGRGSSPVVVAPRRGLRRK